MSEERPHNNGFEAFSPAEIARRVETVGVTKARMNLFSKFMLGALAGAFVALGAIGYTVVLTGSPVMGIVRLVGGLVFSTALILIIVGGAELFTGNTLLVMAYVSRKISSWELLRNWIVVYAGNFVGALVTVGIVYGAGHADQMHGLIGAKMVEIANAKVHYSWTQAFFLGVLCNALVCLAVWLALACRTVTDKILAIPLPIAIFVAAGFEHCVANMYFIPLGILVDGGATPGLNWQAFLLNNLVPVTLGNIVGGSVLVGAIYWVIYLRRQPS